LNGDANLGVRALIHVEFAEQGDLLTARAGLDLVDSDAEVAQHAFFNADRIRVRLGVSFRCRF
jgi:hypothetical protein